MLSGIGPAEELAKFDIPLALNSPEVGQNFRDHGLFRLTWGLQDPAADWVMGSNNSAFDEPQYSYGTASDFIVTTTVPKEGLAKAIEEDEGAYPDWDTQPLLKTNRTFFEHVFTNSGSTDGSQASGFAIAFQQTSVGNVTLASADVSDQPLLNPNYLSTAVDRYVFREGLRQEIAFALSNATIFGRDIIAFEIPAGTNYNVSTSLSVDSTDEYLDARVRDAIR